MTASQNYLWRFEIGQLLLTAQHPDQLPALITLPKLATRSTAFALPPGRRALRSDLSGSEWCRGAELGEKLYWRAVVAQSGQQVSELHIVSQRRTRRAPEPAIPSS
jgi:hypothetical protein